MTYDRKLAALYAIMAEWGRTDIDYLTRVNHLNGSLAGGLNGSSYLNPATVHAAAGADTLMGSLNSLDWFFASNLDVLKNQRSGEIVTPIF
jgi:hypothetical protein